MRHLSYVGATTGFVCLVTSLTACSGDVGGGPTASTTTSTTSGTSSGGANTTGTGTTGTSMGGGSGGTGGLPPPTSCVPGIAETSQVPRLKNQYYDNIVKDVLGVELLGNGEVPSSLLNTDSTGPMNRYMWEAYINAASVISAEVMAGPNRQNFISCDPAAAGCLEQTIATFGRKAFRRPLQPAEVASFLELGNTTPPGTPEEVAETTLLAFLLSPSFLQVNEVNESMEGEYFSLTSHEVATRLSLMLWGTVGDDELMRAADANELTTREQILEQAQRMLGLRDKAAPRIGEYHRHYLALDDDAGHWFKERPDPATYPLYKPEADAAMAEELDAFFEEVAYSGGSFSDIFLSTVAFVNVHTAPLYGVDATGLGDELVKVNLDATQRPGFLTRLGFLSSHAHATFTSPILRGAYIAKNIIGTDRELSFDPSVLKRPPPEGVFTTERDYVTELTNDQACRGCHHIYINPPGFVLDGFDATGAVQTVDPRGGAINTTADVLFGDELVTITTPLEMMELIAEGDFTRRSYATKLVAAATGRFPNGYDACLVDVLDSKLTMDGYRIVDLIADITQVDSFRLRNRAAN